MKLIPPCTVPRLRLVAGQAAEDPDGIQEWAATLLDDTAMERESAGRRDRADALRWRACELRRG
jgi:hypothetical protein